MNSNRQSFYDSDPSNKLSDNISMPEDIFLRYRYGVDDKIIRSLGETAQLFEMTMSDAVQLELAAIDKLSPNEREKLSAEDRIPSWQV